VTAAAPAAGGRIEVLDVMRGVAILAIVLLNLPWQAGSIPALLDDPRRLGWSAADRATWIALDVLVTGTQRCLLELLFGAGVVLLGARLDGRAYLRRNLWLLAIGLVDIGVLLWIGDILAAYAIAGLLVFPLRRLEVRQLAVLGLSFALWSACYGGLVYAGERAFAASLTEAERAATPTPAQAKVLDAAASAVRVREAAATETAGLLEEERRAHDGGWLDYARWFWSLWYRIDLAGGLLVETVIEAAATMLLGMALMRTGFLAGEWRSPSYLLVGGACYAIGLACRITAALEVADGTSGARIAWIVEEPARLLIGIGHVCAINLVWRTAAGTLLLRPFAAAGRMALTLYLLAQLIGLHLLFAPYGLDLWGRFGWAGMTAISGAVMLALLASASLWLRHFSAGPVEAAWRRLATPSTERPRSLCASGSNERSG
jgi:uncharacterized protein